MKFYFFQLQLNLNNYPTNIIFFYRNAVAQTVLLCLEQRKKFVRAEVRLTDMDLYKNILEEKDIEIISLEKRTGRIKFRITKVDIDNSRVALKQIFETAYKEWSES